MYQSFLIYQDLHGKYLLFHAVLRQWNGNLAPPGK
jgi:hypothetical protein